MLWRRITLVLVVLGLLAATIPAHGWGNCALYHRVRYGQTLASIARYYGTSVGYLVSINGIYNPNRIYAGQLLCINLETPPQTTYVVQRGDSLSRIAQRFGVSLYDLIYANNIRNPNLIYVGQVLLIPSYGYGGGYNPVPYNAQSYALPGNDPQMYSQPIPPPMATQEPSY